jgi:hypothetical protein
MTQQPTEVYKVIDAARRAGREAAKRKYDLLRAESRGGRQLLDVCGGAVLVLKIDGRSRKGKWIRSLMKTPHAGFSIEHNPAFGYVLAIHDMIGHQERSVNEAAQRAALAVVSKGLGVEGHISTFVD